MGGFVPELSQPTIVKMGAIPHSTIRPRANFARIGDASHKAE
jgi:hypothetical protein